MAEAITKVMGEVTQLEKSDKNPQGNYKFASIDGFLDMVRPLMAKNGLGLCWQETKFELLPNEEPGKKGWLAIRMDFYLTFEDTIWGPFSRTIMNMMMGAQSFGAAQSYGIKQFLRGQFMISTGDGEDADFSPPGESPRIGQEQKPPPARAKADPNKVSRQQFNYMMKLWKGHQDHKDHPIDEKILKEWCERRFKVTSRAHLTKKQVSDIIEVLTKENPGPDIEAYVTHEQTKETPPPEGDKY